MNVPYQIREILLKDFRQVKTCGANTAVSGKKLNCIDSLSDPKRGTFTQVKG